MGRFVGLRVFLWSAIAVLSVAIYRMDEWTKETPEKSDVHVDGDLQKSGPHLVHFIPKSRLDMSRVRIHMS